MLIHWLQTPPAHPPLCSRCRKRLGGYQPTINFSIYTVSSSCYCCLGRRSESCSYMTQLIIAHARSIHPILIATLSAASTPSSISGVLAQWYGSVPLSVGSQVRIPLWPPLKDLEQVPRPQCSASQLHLRRRGVKVYL